MSNPEDATATSIAQVGAAPAAATTVELFRRIALTYGKPATAYHRTRAAAARRRLEHRGFTPAQIEMHVGRAYDALVEAGIRAAR